MAPTVRRRGVEGKRALDYPIGDRTSTLWITLTVCGLLGASIFFAVVRSMMSDEPLGCCLALFVVGLPGAGLIL